MKLNQVPLGLTLAATVFTAQAANAAGNLIDQTWGAGAGTSYGPVIDKVSISFVSAPAPEPGTWALLVLGLGAIGAIRRLRD